MPTEIENLLRFTANYEKMAGEALTKVAKKDSGKKDPKAKVRNRGTVVFPANSSSVKDDKDHFPINDEDQARNALARANQYSSVPEWYSGSLKSLVNAVAKKVHSKYPKIEVSEDAKKPGKGGGKKKSAVIELAEKLMARAEIASDELQQVYRELEGLGFKQMKINDAIGDAQLAGKDTDYLRKERNDLEEKVLELRQKRDQLEQKTTTMVQEQGAQPMGPMDSPWGEFGAGAADDGKI